MVFLYGEPALNASGGVDTDLFSILAHPLKGNDSVNLGKDGVVFSKAHIIAGMYLGASLTDQDVSSLDLLATIAFYPVSLAGTVPPVPGTAACFLVCHRFSPLFKKTLNLLGDVFDPDKGKLLPMPSFSAVALSPLVLEDHHFSVFAMVGDPANDLAVFEERFAHLNFFTV
jgi:hypothetical protein